MVLQYHKTMFVGLIFLFSIADTGATYTNNYALSFDGVDDILKIIHMNTDLSLADFWSAEAWVKPYSSQIENFQPNIVGFPGRHPNLEFCGNTTQCDNPTKSLAQLRELSGAYYTIVGSQTLDDTTGRTWYHMSATWNNKTFCVYVNGIVDKCIEPYTQGYNAPLGCSFQLCDEGIDIGGYRFITQAGNYYSGQYFKGIIDEVRVWSVGRTQAEIQTNMNTVLSGGEPGLLYYWRFDEGHGLLTTSLARTSYGALGGGIQPAEPKWVVSDAPLKNDYPPPQGATCHTNESGLYATAAILSIVFVIGGIVLGIFGYRMYSKGSYKGLN